MNTDFFVEALVAELVLNHEVKELRIHSPKVRKGLQCVVDLLDRQTETQPELVYVANDLRPSSIGAFDGFAHSLLGSSIRFKTPKPYAKSILEQMPESDRELVIQAAALYAKVAL